MLLNTVNSHNKISSITKKRWKASRGVVLLAATLSSALLSTPVSAASSAWSAEQLLPLSSAQATNVRTAINAAGTSVTVWDQYITGSADPAHLYGRWQVYASVCTPRPVPQTPNCSTPQAFTDSSATSDATNAGAVVSPSGTITVFWNSVATTPVYSAYSSSNDAGATWSPVQQVPGDPGYTLFAGVYSEVGPSVGVDGSGNIIAVMVNPPTGTYVMSTRFSAQALVKDIKTGLWSSPVQLSTAATGIFGSTKLFVNNDGQALLNMGFTSFRRQANGTWGAPQTVSTVGMGQIYSASAGFDAGGKAYFVYRSRYGGAYLATATPTAANPDPAWTTPKHIAKFDILGSSLLVRGSSAGHAIVFGTDYNTGNVRATVTANGGATWGNLVNLGVGSNPHVAGSENGLYALSWDSAGANWDRYVVATGTGIGTGTAAWAKANLVGNNATGPLAIAGNTIGGPAQVIASWVRWDALGEVVGLSMGIARP